MKPRAPIQIQRDDLLVQVAQLQKSLAAKDGVIQSLKAELSTLNQQMTVDKSTSLAQVSELQKSLAAKDGVIQDLKAELSRTAQVVIEKNDLLTQLEQSQKSLAEKDEVIKSLIEQFENLNRQFDDLQNDVVVIGEDNTHFLHEE